MDNKSEQSEKKCTLKEMLLNNTGSLFTHFKLSFIFSSQFRDGFFFN